MAHNSYFLPGDALFHTRITEESLKQLNAGKDIRFNYERPDPESVNFCGYAGFSKLVIKKPDASTLQKLAVIKIVYKNKFEERIFQEQKIYDKNGLIKNTKITQRARVQ